MSMTLPVPALHGSRAGHGSSVGAVRPVSLAQAAGTQSAWAVRARLVRWDGATLGAALLAALVSVVALIWSYDHNWLMNYSDAVHHMNIARRVLDNRTPGIAQLGTVWLPLPHMLMIPFAANSYLWRTGLAGSAVGLPCYVLASVMLFQSVRLVARYQFAAWIALAVFISNPNALYMQATALTEPVLLMSLSASAYYFLRWSILDETRDLISASLLAILAVGSRYDGWFFAAVCGLLLGVITLLRWRDAERTEGLTLAYLVVPVYGMFLWLFYNWLIFGDALAFERGKFSAGTQQAQFAASGLLPTKLHFLLSLSTYSGTVLLNLGSVIMALGVVGLVVYAAVNRLRPESLAVYAYFSVFAFNVLALYFGQTIITSPHTNPAGYFNLRYGLVVLPAAAFIVGYLADVMAQRYKPLLIAVAMGLLLLLQGALWVPAWPMRVVTIAEGLSHSVSTHESLPAAGWLRGHYHGGGILYDDSHAVFIAAAGIDMGEYYLAGPLQTKALANPAHYAAWVVLAPYTPGDAVNAALRGSRILARSYRLTYSADNYAIYQRVGPAPALAR